MMWADLTREHCWKRLLQTESVLRLPLSERYGSVLTQNDQVNAVAGQVQHLSSTHYLFPREASWCTYQNDDHPGKNGNRKDSRGSTFSLMKVFIRWATGSVAMSTNAESHR